MKRVLFGLVAILTAGSPAHAGPLKRMFHGSACRPTAPRYAPAACQPAPMVMPVVVRTSYDGVGVPVDATPYQPIKLGAPLPAFQACPNCPGR